MKNGTQCLTENRPQTCPVSLLLSLLLGIAISACHDARAGTRYSVQQLGTAEGLSQSNVMDIMRDSFGLLWFATRDGLCRYDGYDFRVYRHRPYDPQSPGAPSIEVLAEAADSTIWLAVGKLGLDRMDRRTGVFRHYRHDPADEHSLGSHQVTALLNDRSGRLWVGTRSGLNRYRPATDDFERLQAATIRDSMPNSLFIRQLAEDGSGRLVVLTAEPRIVVLNPDNMRRRDYPLPQYDLHFIGADSSGAVILGRKEMLYRPGAVLAYRLEADGAFTAIADSDYDGLPSLMRSECHAEALGVEADGSLWMVIASLDGGGREDGIYRLDAVTVSARLVVPLEGLYISHDLSFLQGRDGITWIGMRDGVYKVVPQPREFRCYRHSEAEGSLSNNYIRSLHFGRRDTLWVGTEAGLNMLAPGAESWQRLHAEGSMGRRDSRSIINEICELPDGTLLLGTNQGILQVDRQRGVLTPGGFDYRCLDSSELSGFWSLVADSDGSLWAGTRDNGILRFDAERVCLEVINTRTRKPEQFTGGLVWDMRRDSRGHLWVATSMGLNRLLPDGRNFATYRPDSTGTGSLSGNNVCALFEDRDARLWALTYGSGINRYDPDRDAFQSFTTREGLPDDVVYGMLQDAEGAYWCSTNKGLARLILPDGPFRVYRDREDLQDNEFSFKAFAAASDGRLAFGGINGLNIFDPRDLVKRTPPPPIVITAFRVLDSLAQEDIRPGDELRVDYRQSYVSFEFAALDYANPSQNRYAYRLEGFNDRWVNNGFGRKAVFTNLDPGRYLLRVRGSNNEGVWNDEGAAVTLHVVPPFWLTTWFRILTIGGGLLLLALVLGLRLRSTLQKNDLQRRLLEYRLQTLRLQMNPHFIFNALASIEHLILKRDVERAAAYLTRFSRLVRGMLESGRRSTISLEHELHNLRLYLELESLRFKGAFRYELNIDPALDPPNLRVPPLLIQPYVENALRHGRIHSQADGRVDVGLQLRDDRMYCVIEDNGIGRKGARARRSAGPWQSLGMSVTGERLELLNSTRDQRVTSHVCDLFAPDGRPCGTRVELWIPLRAEALPSSMENL